jgi:hypothetical protein
MWKHGLLFETTLLSAWPEMVLTGVKCLKRVDHPIEKTSYPQNMDGSNKAAPSSGTIVRAWSTVLPIKSHRLQMIGYESGVEGGWHLAFVKAGSDAGEAPVDIWVFPASACTCMWGMSEAESGPELASAFQEFLRAESGIAVALLQHPRDFGPLIVGGKPDIAGCMFQRQCRGALPGAFTGSTATGACVIETILCDLGVKQIHLRYPALSAEEQESSSARFRDYLAIPPL